MRGRQSEAPGGGGIDTLVPSEGLTPLPPGLLPNGRSPLARLRTAPVSF